MSFDLMWMRPNAPYMPIATVGLLTAMSDAGLDATAVWRPEPSGEVLEVRTEASVEQTAQAIVDAPWPQLDRIPWANKPKQGLNPTLRCSPEPAAELRRLRAAVDAADRSALVTGEPRLVGERRLLRAFVTEAVITDQGLGRSHLLRGVKSDLSGVADDVRIEPLKLASELAHELVWLNGSSGRGLGLVPEVQTFGGTTGRDPSATNVGSHSVLLYRLLWLGILALHPVGVRRRSKRIVGGPLFTDLVDGEPTLSWPTWSIPVSARMLARLFDLSAIHVPRPDPHWLADRGITSVHRSTTVKNGNTARVFRWGKRVA